MTSRRPLTAYESGLYRKMKAICKAFCDYHGISVPRLRLSELPQPSISKGLVTLGNHTFNEYHEGVIRIDCGEASARRGEKEKFETLFHELTHQWQELALGKEVYDELDNIMLAHIVNVHFWKCVFRGQKEKILRRAYLESAFEVEARSFARSIIEELYR